MKKKLIPKPIKSVTRCKASEMTAMEPEMYPPTNSPAIKTKEIAMTMYNLQKFAL